MGHSLTTEVRSGRCVLDVFFWLVQPGQEGGHGRTNQIRTHHRDMRFDAPPHMTLTCAIVSVNPLARVMQRLSKQAKGFTPRRSVRTVAGGVVKTLRIQSKNAYGIAIPEALAYCLVYATRQAGSMCPGGVVVSLGRVKE